MPASIVRDAVHNYIPIEPDDVQFLDHPVFQRLKLVRQTNAWHLFPSATHTRFSHSVGTMYLAVRVFDSLVKNAPDSFPDDSKELEVLRRTLRYAALLHDVGHAPLSHVTEGLFPELKVLSDQLTAALEPYGVDYQTDITLPGRHELTSCIVAVRVFGAQLVALGVDLEWMCRMILGHPCPATGGVRNVLVSVVNSPTDVDKLDYILRDGMATLTISVDEERIVTSVTVDDHGRLAFKPSALSVIWSLVVARSYLYMWVYTHHKVTWSDFVVKEALSRIISGEAALNGGVSETAGIFTPERIITHAICDADVYAILRDEKNRATIGFLYDALFARSPMSNLWKSYYEFTAKMTDDANRKFVFDLAESREKVKKLAVLLDCGEDDIFILKGSLSPFTAAGASKLRVITDAQNPKISHAYSDVFNISLFTSAGKDHSAPIAVPWVYYNKDKVSGADVLALLNAPDVIAQVEAVHSA